MPDQLTEQRREAEDYDCLLNLEFWQRQSAEARMAETWRLSLVAYQTTGDAVETRMQKQVESFQRIPSFTPLELR